MQKYRRLSLLLDPRFIPLRVILILATLLSSSWSAVGAEPTSLAEATGSTPGTLLLSAFYSSPQDIWMQVDWETALEINIQGFNLYRRLDPQDAWVQVNEQLIQAANLGGFGTANYAWLDTGAQAGTFYEYLLEEVDLSGKIHQYGPSGTSPARLVYQHLFLPVVQH
jgi:hypothetical protein